MQGGDRDSLGVRLPQEFDAFFGKATGHEPYEYQRALARAPSPPSVLDVPTGSGKTQGALAAWMYQRLVGRSTPRRLVYALPMRTLVEQTLGVAEDMRRKLELATDDLPIHVLMGGAEPESDWRLSPERAQILVGTIDMLLSRALNRGYGESRFAWPVSFGLLNADCRWVFDELQLMGPARATSAQLDGLRRTVGTDLGCETMWMSATVDQSAVLTVDRPELGEVLALQSSDRTARLAQRLHARKIVRRVEPRDIDPRSRSGSIAHTTIDHHQEGTRTLVVLNTVERAQQVARILRRELVEREDPPNVALLHSRYRPQDRDQHVLDALAPVDERCAGVIVVATQVVEAGVDLSSRTLITDLAPFSSIVQRLGRCNRFGEFREATVLWLDPGELPAGKRGREVAAPYLIPDLERSRAALLPLEGESLSPDVLAQLEVEEEVDDPTVLRRRDLLDLFDTSPDLSGLDVDVAPFIREDDDRNVMVFFRELGAEPAARVTEAAPGRLELVQVPRSSLGKRNRWVLDHVEGEWVRQDRVPPGATVMLAAGDGGYHSLEGWDPALKEPVAPVPEAEGPAAEGYGDDPLSVKQMPQELLEHLEEVAEEVSTLAEQLALDAAVNEALRRAAALHDVGKAHPVFQETLRSTIIAGDERAGDRLWAKSGKKGGRHRRPYFRHELASLLAIRTQDSELAGQHPDLVHYLVAAHHGKVRLSIRPAPEEKRPSDGRNGARFALGVIDGDSLPAVPTPVGQIGATRLDLTPMEFGAPGSWTDCAVRLRDDPDLGPFRLGLLEALLRIADWRASG